MPSKETKKLILGKAKELGADLSGIVLTRQLKESPSHMIFPKIGRQQKAVGWCGFSEKYEIAWPQDMQSVLVIAVSHPKEKPELDWWQGKGTKGNSMLIALKKKLCRWIQETLAFKARSLPYYIEKGGCFLKDAAMLSGLGCIGKNNMLLTPEYGPRIRLGALLLEPNLGKTEPISFDPCADCEVSCRLSCPQKAFENSIFDPFVMGTKNLPARNGCYDRVLCGVQMDRDLKTGLKHGEELGIVKFCRAASSLVLSRNKSTI